MEPKYLYTIRWTQPYATYQMRPYLRHLRDEYERVIEDRLERNEFDDAQQVIKRIMKL
jgi:enolase